MSDAGVVHKPLSMAPEKLRLLADWFDATTPNTPPEVQDDLRHWADLIETLVGAIVDAEIVKATEEAGYRRWLGETKIPGYCNAAGHPNTPHFCEHIGGLAPHYPGEKSAGS